MENIRHVGRLDNLTGVHHGDAMSHFRLSVFSIDHGVELQALLIILLTAFCLLLAYKAMRAKNWTVAEIAEALEQTEEEITKIL